MVSYVPFNHKDMWQCHIILELWNMESVSLNINIDFMGCVTGLIATLTSINDISNCTNFAPCCVKVTIENLT